MLYIHFLCLIHNDVLYVLYVRLYVFNNYTLCNSPIYVYYKQLIVLNQQNNDKLGASVNNTIHCFLIYCNIGNLLMQQEELGHVYSCF